MYKANNERTSDNNIIIYPCSNRKETSKKINPKCNKNKTLTHILAVAIHVPHLEMRNEKIKGPTKVVTISSNQSSWARLHQYANSTNSRCCTVASHRIAYGDGDSDGESSDGVAGYVREMQTQVLNDGHQSP